jgi:hypothetical protein
LALLKGGQLDLLRSFHFYQNRNTMLCLTSITSFSENVFGRYSAYIAPDENIIVCDAANNYSPRNPEDNLLYGIIAENLETFLSLQSTGSDDKRRLVPPINA